MSQAEWVLVEERRKEKRKRRTKRFLLISGCIVLVIIAYPILQAGLFIIHLNDYEINQEIFELVEVTENRTDRDMWYDGAAFHYDTDYYFRTNSTRLGKELESNYLLPVGTLLWLKFEIRHYARNDHYQVVFIDWTLALKG